jgi:acylphosphatase
VLWLSFAPFREKISETAGSATLGIFMKRWRMQVLYSGRVQGVGFRYQTKRQATGFEVSGTVRNLLDGRVELVAEGERSELEEFRKAIRECGLGPMIRNEDVTWVEATGGFRGFEIVR